MAFETVFVGTRIIKTANITAKDFSKIKKISVAHARRVLTKICLERKKVFEKVKIPGVRFNLNTKIGHYVYTVDRGVLDADK